MVAIERSEQPLFLCESGPVRRGHNVGNQIPEDLIHDITTDHMIRGNDALILDEEGLRKALFMGLSNWEATILEEDNYNILVVGKNLGIGSSRENAAESIKQNGIKIVVAKSFGPIFFENLINQGVIPSTNFDMLRKTMDGNTPQFEELTEDLSFVQQRILRFGGLPGYIQAVHQDKEPFPQDMLDRREAFPQTAVEKLCTNANPRFDKTLFKAGDSMILRADELIGYDVFVAHMQRILKRYFGGELSFHPKNIWFFIDHFRNSEDPNAVKAVETVREFWQQHPESYMGLSGVYNKVLPLRLPPESVIAGMDSHSPELGIIPGTFVIPIGYTAAACAMANDGLLPYTIPPTIKLEIIGSLPGYCDIKDTIWQLVQDHFGNSLGNGMMFEISGSGYAALPYVEAVKIFNAVTEFGGIGAVGTTLNPQVIRYLRINGQNLMEIEEQDLETIFENIKPDKNANYIQEIQVDLRLTEPSIVGPHSHKKVVPLSALSEPIEFDRIIFNSCAGSSILDISILATVLRNYIRKIPVDVHLADPITRIQAEKLGLLGSLANSGVKISDDHTCGPCLGQGARVNKGERVLSTNNRNYPGRMGDEKDAKVYLSSATVAAVTAKLGRSPSFEEVKEHQETIKAAKEMINRLSST